MRNRYFSSLALAASGLFLVACSGGNDINRDASDDDGSTGSDTLDASLPGPDGGLGCCPVGFDLYACQEPNGGSGYACHNPALGCASSETCGQGCDPQVSGRCACVQIGACILGYHPDTILCQCVPDEDAGGMPAVDARPACVDTVLCVQGDHFDTVLCKCVPDTSSTGCANASDCQGALPALCQQCPDGSSGCAHFECVAAKCEIAYCP